MSPPKDIRTCRLALGLKQSDVARLAGVTPTDLRRWERGLDVPPLEQLCQLAPILHTPVAKLKEAQERLTELAIPGEGYTTSQAGNGRTHHPRRSVLPKKHRVLDLFCGAGGLSFGFEASGEYVTTAGIDLLSDRIATFVTNHPHARAVEGDVTTYSPDALADIVGPVDVIVGGPPCQGFSSIRPFRTPTERDQRNNLVDYYVRVIHTLKPKWFLFENVVGILKHQNGQRLKELLVGLERAGYEADWRVVNSALFGAPQHRERVVVVGNRDGCEFVWPLPTHHCEYKSMAGQRPEVIRTLPLFSRDLPPAVTLMEAISDLPPVRAGEEATEYAMPPQNDFQHSMRSRRTKLSMHRATRHSARMLEIIRHAGNNISALPPGMVKSGFSSCYSRLDADRPSTTLTVNFVHPASNRCIHPHQNRALTPREGARIQTFPDSFEFKGTIAQVVKQIGNAVPPMVGRVFAEAILQSEGESRPSVSRPITELSRTHSYSLASSA